MVRTSYKWISGLGPGHVKEKQMKVMTRQEKLLSPRILDERPQRRQSRSRRQVVMNVKNSPLKVKLRYHSDYIGCFFWTGDEEDPKSTGINEIHLCWWSAWWLSLLPTHTAGEAVSHSLSDFIITNNLDCVMCYETLAYEGMKPAKLKRHMETKHKEYMGRHTGFFERKRDKLTQPLRILST